MPDIVIHCKFDVVLQKCRKRLYIRPKVVGPFPVPCVRAPWFSKLFVDRYVRFCNPGAMQPILAEFDGAVLDMVARCLACSLPSKASN
jgi:hypothetical protein